AGCRRGCTEGGCRRACKRARSLCSYFRAKASIEGSTKLEWGIDLGAGKVTKDSIAHGFKNSGSWKVSFPLFEKKSFTSKADTPVYAEVIIKDVELGIQSKNKSKKEKDFAFTGKVDEIVGTLYFYDAYLKIYKKPGFKVNYAQIWDPLKADDWDKTAINLNRALI
ncbi:hypothetical protein HW453_16540, partial [Treponema phagedenis]